LCIEQVFDTVRKVEASVASLQIAAARGRPVATADTRLLEVPGALGGLFPEGGVRRGSTVVIGSGSGGSSIAMTLAAAVTSGGSWAAAVGLPSLGLAAASELGVRLERLALVPHPGAQWTMVAAALLDGVDLLILAPPPRVRGADARRLAARARERGVVMAVLDGATSGRATSSGMGWPEPPDIKLAVIRSAWDGLGAGHGHLKSRRVDLRLTGRRAAARERCRTLWLPGPDGEVATLFQAPVDGAALVS
jgi:hypothetical protein